MNEEQAVLDFFSLPENLPLALSVAEQVDNIRMRLNNEFWHRACARLTTQISDWRIALTEDRNTPDRYVGLHLQPASEQNLYLQPMMEQQVIEGETRIYFGLMWSSSPTDDKKQLPDIAALHDKLQHAGYKSNDRFLAWRWTALYPQRKHFLLRLNAHPDELLHEATAPLLDQLASHGTELFRANKALREIGTSTTVSLDQLRMNLAR